MKKFFLAIVLVLCCFISKAQDVNVFKANYYSSAVRLYDGSYEWSRWEKSDVKIAVSTRMSFIEVFSPRKQYYIIGDMLENNSQFSKFSATDEEGINCVVAFKYLTNYGKVYATQMYVFYNDIAWAYEIPE